MKLRNWLGRKAGKQSATATDAEVAATEQYRGCELCAMPIREESVWRVAGRVTQPGGGETQSFVRADTCASHDDAVALSLQKARQLVYEAGVRTKQSD